MVPREKYCYFLIILIIKRMSIIHHIKSIKCTKCFKKVSPIAHPVVSSQRSYLLPVVFSQLKCPTLVVLLQTTWISCPWNHTNTSLKRSLQNYLSWSLSVFCGNITDGLLLQYIDLLSVKVMSSS